MAQGDAAFYLYENVDVAGAPGTATAYLYENVDVAGAPGTATAYLYENVDVAGSPAAATAYFYENVLGDSNTQFFHFQLRADTASGAADDVTVNVKWVVGGVAHDLGNFTSFSASPTGDSPWRDIAVPIDAVYDDTKTNRAEISMGAESYVPLSVTSSWYSDAFDQFEEPSTALVRTGPTSTRFYSTSGSDNYGVQRIGIGYLLASKTYRMGFYMRDLQPWTNHIAYLEAQSNSTSAQFGLDGPRAITTTGWTLVSGSFKPPYDGFYEMVTQHFKDNDGLLMETFVDDEFLSEVIDPVPSTSVDNAHIRNVWITTPGTLPVGSTLPPYTNNFDASLDGTWLVKSRQQAHVLPAWGTDSGTVSCTNSTIYSSTAYDAMLLRTGYTNDFDMSVRLGAEEGSGFNPYIFAFRVNLDDDDGAYGLSYWMMTYSSIIYFGPNLGGGTSYGWTSDLNFASGDIARLRCVGTNFKVYKNGALILDQDISGRPGELQTGTAHGLTSLGPQWRHYHFDQFSISKISTTVESTDIIDYGAYPKGFDYVEDVEDGILNNGSEVLNFYYVGNYSEYVVPPMITSLDIECWGAQGGDTNRFPGTNLGGRGGYIKSRVAVTPGETLRVYVGGIGSGGGPGGFNGGGAGGSISGSYAGGGGATDVRRAPYGLADRLVVAGGGSGAPGGTATSGAASGNGGSTTGQSGSGGYFGATGGTGGTQTAGGARGTSTSGCAFLVQAQPGSFGQGGNGASGSGCLGQGTGGGGGGWYGGGGGGLEGSYGGGGSSYAVGVISSSTQGVRTGNGTATITRVPIVILNDNGTIPDAAYYVEQGPAINPSPHNYSVTWGSKTAGTYAKDYDNWIDTGALWLIDGTGAVMSGYSTHPPFGTPLFTMFGKNWYPQLRPDGFNGAPHHHIDMYVTTAGSRGMSLIGPIWGWNSWNDYFFAVNGGHSLPSGPGVYQVQGGVPTFLGPLDANSLGGEIQVRHDFLTGDLHVWATDFFMGGVSHYYGTHPHTVQAGHSGWMADEPNQGIFGDTTWCYAWSNIYDPGSFARTLQYSMQTNAVVVQSPATWYFKATKIAKWIVGAVGWS